MEVTNKGVLVIYTGGTIGSKPRDRDDPDSPQFVVGWNELKEATPELANLPFPIDCYEFAEPLDSCNVGPREWAEIATAIAARYDDYEGFVILHGTDTMVYTASALSFMLRDLGKPVVVTGSQRSAMVDVRNDAVQNVVTALMVANAKHSKIPVIPEVVISFGGLVLRGNRSVKRDTSSYRAYESPNMPPLGEAGNRILIDEALIRPRPIGKFRAVTRLNTNVAAIFIFPGIQHTDMVARQLSQPGLQAAVVHAYGSGDIPTNKEFLDAFKQAHDEREVILVACTQCSGGAVQLGIYDTSAMLLAAGFISAHDISKEAAQCKLMSLLGDPDITQEEAEALFQQNMAGEQSHSTYITKFPGADTGELVGATSDASRPGAVRVPGRPLGGEVWDRSAIQSAILRLRGARMPGATNESPAEFRIFLNADEADTLSVDHEGYAGTFRKSWSEDVPVLTFDVTGAVAPIASPGTRMSFTLVMESPGVTCSWDAVDLAIIVREG